MRITRYFPASGPLNFNFVYDRQGRLTQVNRAVSSIALLYNYAGLLVRQTQTGDTLNGYMLTNSYDAYLRKSYVAAKNPSGALYGAATYGYDTASRLQTVSANGATVTYGYLANSRLVGDSTAQQSGTTRLTVNKRYDDLNRLSAISSAPSGAAALSYSYGYNDANQRVQVNLADGTFWVYEYDSLGQVRSGKRYWNDCQEVQGGVGPEQSIVAHAFQGSRSASGGA